MRYPAGTIGFPTILVVYRHIDLSDLFFCVKGFDVEMEQRIYVRTTN